MIKNSNNKYQHQGGQALVTLLIFTAMAITITTTGAVLLITNLRGTTSTVASYDAYMVAESGVENALMQLLRNPNYSGETLTINNGTATITVEGDNPKIVTAVGRAHGFQRTVEAQVNDTLGMLEVLNWQEVY